MDKKSKIFFLIIFGLIVASVIATYYRVYAERDYQIITEISCDPSSEENCFVYEDENGEISYYKLINKNISQVPSCAVGDEGCPELSCSKNEKDCSYTYCEPSNLSGEESCAGRIVDNSEVEE